jgi:hypothetical protein
MTHIVSPAANTGSLPSGSDDREFRELVVKGELRSKPLAGHCEGLAPSARMCRNFVLAALVSFSLAGAPGVPDSPKAVFDPGRAHAIQIKMSAEAWDLLQPGNGQKKATPGATREQGIEAGVRLRRGSSGYAYVLSELEFDGQGLDDVGIRFGGR